MTKKIQKEENEVKTVSFLVKLPRPQEFEGKTYSEIDLSGLEDLTTADLAKAEKLFIQLGHTDPMKEFNTQFCMIVAHLATELPFEFFNALKIPNATAIKAVVSGFLYATE